MKEYSNLVETLINLYTFKDSKLQILLARKKNDPYKGYWVIPGNIITVKETLEQNVENTIKELIGLTNVNVYQNKTYSNITRDSENRVLATSYFTFIDVATVDFKIKYKENVELKWFDINEIPKLGYDHVQVLEDCIKTLRKEVTSISLIRNLFPADFSLPELQKFYEQLLNITIDRRNFRKKMINLDMIEDTGLKNEHTNGRPAKLYQFKDNIEEKNIF